MANNNENTTNVEREVKFLSQQVTTMFEQLNKRVEELKSEFLYLDEQCERIYDRTMKSISQAKDSVREDIKTFPNVEVFVDYQRVADEVVAGLKRLDDDAFTSRLADKIAQAVCDKLQIEDDAEEEEDCEYTCSAEDCDAFADKIAARIQAALACGEKCEPVKCAPAQETVATVEIDYAALADCIIERLPEVDYEALTAPVKDETKAALAEVLADGAKDAAYERLSQAIAEKLQLPSVEVDFEALAAEIAKNLSVNVTAVAAEEPVEEPVEELVEEPAEEAVEELSVTAAEPAAEPAEEPVEEPVEETPAPVVQPEAEGDSSVIRLKRSYECKLRQSEEEVKYYYSELKNELLAYNKVKSNLSWNGDRYNFGRETVAKMAINGKTLCLYLALNPDEYSLTKYHQKYVGNVKAYENTPMMLKVKSKMGLKKATSLIFEMMEGLGAQRNHTDKVDYVEEFAYKTDEEMLAEGQIKATVTEKKDLSNL